MFTVEKGAKSYSVQEHEKKWVLSRKVGQVEVSFNVPKELCNTADELREYVLSTEMY